MITDRCHECGAPFVEDDEKAEVYEPASGAGPFLVHADPCYLQNQAKYSLA